MLSQPKHHLWSSYILSKTHTLSTGHTNQLQNSNTISGTQIISRVNTHSLVLTCHLGDLHNHHTSSLRLISHHQGSHINSSSHTPSPKFWHYMQNSPTTTRVHIPCLWFTQLPWLSNNFWHSHIISITHTYISRYHTLTWELTHHPHNSHNIFRTCIFT